MTIQNGVDYNSLDGKPVYLCFMIAAPQDGGSIHLQALAKLSTLLMNEEFRNELMNAKSAEQFIEIINQEEANACEAPRPARRLFIASLRVGSKTTAAGVF